MSVEGSPQTFAPQPQGLVLYKAVALADQAAFAEEGKLPMKISGPDAGHVGLRESPDEALERASRFADRVTKETHCVLEVEFTKLGIAHFTQLRQGAELWYSPTLFKKTYRGPTDWGVWHFLIDLPLHAVNEEGDVLIKSEWKFIQ